MNIPRASVWPTVTFDTTDPDEYEQALEWASKFARQIIGNPEPQPEVETVVNRRAALLREAERLVNSDRNTTYDDPTIDFARISGLWSVYLGRDLSTVDVAALMALLKLARIMGNPDHEDSWIDLAGYAACGWDCVGES